MNDERRALGILWLALVVILCLVAVARPLVLAALALCLWPITFCLLCAVLSPRFTPSSEEVPDAA